MKPARILMVDDEPGQLASVRRILGRSGYEICTAANGRIGLRMVLQDPPDLILLDVAMPKMSGHEFLRRLRRLEARGRTAPHRNCGTGAPLEIPVLFVTALSAPHQRVTGLDAGAVDYITKPFDPDELRARVRRHLRQAGQSRWALAAARLEQLQLEAALGKARETLTACAEPLSDLVDDLELVQRVRIPELRDELLNQAQANTRRLAQSVTRAADKPPNGGQSE